MFRKCFFKYKEGLSSSVTDKTLKDWKKTKRKINMKKYCYSSREKIDVGVIHKGLLMRVYDLKNVFLPGTRVWDHGNHCCGKHLVIQKRRQENFETSILHITESLILGTESLSDFCDMRLLNVLLLKEYVIESSYTENHSQSVKQDI